MKIRIAVFSFILNEPLYLIGSSNVYTVAQNKGWRRLTINRLTAENISERLRQGRIFGMEVEVTCPLSISSGHWIN